jgi:hypothetical protein
MLPGPKGPNTQTEKLKKSGTLPLPPDKATQPQRGSLSTLVMDQSTHENPGRDEPNSPGSDRTFGLVMAGALALVGAVIFTIPAGCGDAN